MVVTPGEKVRDTFNGIRLCPRDLKLGLIDSAENKIGSVRGPGCCSLLSLRSGGGKYGLAILRVIRLGAVLTLLGWVRGFCVLATRREG